MNLYEQLREQANEMKRVSPEVQLLLQDPAKFFATTVDALTEDLDQRKMANEAGSREWVLRRSLENEAFALHRGLGQQQEAATSTAFPSGQAITFVTMALPLVRKIFDNLIAMSLVSVQPINQPSAKVFYLDFLDEAGNSVYAQKSTSYSDNTEGSSSIKTLNLKLTGETVDAIEQKLKALWTVELEQDLMAYQGLNAETELMSILQTQIGREVDGKIVAALLAGAGGVGTGVGTGAGNVNWNANGQLVGDTTTTYLRDYKKTIYEALTDADNLIFKKRYRYADWIIGHPDAVVRLEKLEEFKITQGAGQTAQVGRHLVGTLNGKWQVYKDPFFPVTNKFLMGYRGGSWFEACGFYAPYIPLYMTPKLIDTNDFTPRRGLMSRFAYGTLIKDGLATVTITQS